MKLHFDNHGDAMTISAYSSDGITIGGRLLRDPFIVCENEIYVDRLPQKFSELKDKDIKNLVELGQNIILLGSGANHSLLDDQALAIAYSAGVGLEVMTTPAAIRSYNVLVGENRAVAAAFFF